MDKEEIVSDQAIEKVIKETDATMAMEGFEPSEFGNQLYRDYAKGKITEGEALDKIKQHIMSFKKY